MKLFRLEGISVVDPRTAPPSAGPKWCRLFPGKTTRFRADFPPEGITFDAGVFGSFIANWDAIGRPRLPVDYAHDEAGIAAGWIVDLRQDNDGNLEAAIEWTDRARAAIAAQELQYLSPTFAMQATSPLTGKQQGPTLFGAALLNTPFLKDLPRVTAAREPEANKTAETQTKGKTMEMLKKLVGLLGLPEGATEEEVLAAIAALKAPVEKPTPPAPGPSAPTEAACKPAETEATRAASIRAAVELAAEPMRAQLARIETEKLELSKKVAALEREKLEAGLKELVRVSLARGVAAAQDKVTKAFELTGSLDGARAVVEMIPGTVTVGELGHNDGVETDDAASAMKKLSAIAQDIHAKEGIPLADAHIRAMERNLDLARTLSR